MDASRFVKCIGKLEESPEVSQLLKDLGVTKKLKPKRDEDTTLGLPKLGLHLTFEQAEPKSSKLRMSGVEFLSGGDDGDKPFKGALPRGLKFTDSKKAVYKQLGKPSIPMDDDLGMDHWLFDGLQLTVNYDDANESLTSVILALPYEEDDEDDEDEDEDDE